jgi:hypothetical protein
MKPLFWILGGCGGIIVIGAIAFFVLSYFVYNKAKQVSREFQERPALATAKAITALNPDVEVVDADDEKGTITIRNKKTGETITMSADDASKGKLSFKKDGKDVGSVELKAGENSGSLEIKSNEGSAKVGVGISDQAPNWLPMYPGANIQWDLSVHSKDGQTGSLHFVTTDSAERVVRFYEEEFKQAGFTVSTSAVQQGGARSSYVTVEDSGRKRTASATVMPDSGGGNRVQVIFESKE